METGGVPQEITAMLIAEVVQLFAFLILCMSIFNLSDIQYEENKGKKRRRIIISVVGIVIFAILIIWDIRQGIVVPILFIK